MEIVEYKTRNDFNLRLEARLKNGDLVKSRERLSLTTKDAAKLIGISYCTLGKFENLRGYPSPKTQDRILKFYKRNGFPLEKERVFPEWLRCYQPGRLIAEKCISPEKILSLDCIDRKKLPVYEPTQGEDLDRKFLVKDILTTLPEREKKVLEYRFGLNEEIPLTLTETAKKLGVTRERIRQIEGVALHKLRKDKKAREFCKE